MAKFSFKSSKVKGMSVVVPEKEICIYDEAHYYDNNIKKMDGPAFPGKNLVGGPLERFRPIRVFGNRTGRAR